MSDSNDIQRHDEQDQALRSLRQIVWKETEGGARLVRSLLAIAEGNADACTPWHQIEAAKLLHKMFGGDSSEMSRRRRSAQNDRQRTNSVRPEPVEGQSVLIQSPDPSSHSCESRNPEASNIPSTLTGALTGEGRDGREESPTSIPGSPSPEYIKIHQRLAANIRVASYEGATLTRVLLEIVEGHDPEARTKDKIEAAKVLYDWGFSNPHQPTPEQMLQLAPCHPDCLCVCKDMPEDHPDVAKAHKPLTPEQRRLRAEEQAREEEREKRTAELIERKLRDERRRKLQEFHSPEAKNDRRIEREELRKKRQRRKEKKAAYDLEQKGKRVEAIDRQTSLEMDYARDEEFARVRARQSESADDPGTKSDFFYEPLSPEDQALFDYQTSMESGEFKEGELTLKPPTEAARKAYASNLEQMRRTAASEGVPLLPNPLAGTLKRPTARSP